LTRAAAFCLAFCLLPVAVRADPPDSGTAHAAALGADQAAAAASIRGLEDATAAAGTQLANLQAAQAQSQARLTQAEADLDRLLPLMRRLSSAPASTLLAAPLPPDGAVQGVALLRGVAQSIADQARTVQTENAQLAELIAAAQASQQQLMAAATKQAAAEAEVEKQIQAAQAAEMAAADTDAAKITARLQASRRLDTLNDAVNNLIPAAPKPASLTIGAGGAPVAGSIVQAFGAPTAAGPATGISYGAAPGALVTSPCAGMVMFAAPFPSYGLMVIADCGHGDSVILAGMSKLDVAQGEHLAHGQPVGTMQGFNPHDPAHQPRLYVELRQNGAPVDPAPWLNGGHSG
jgi:septal ring factor EnvC (AmiA/AmiB activator)